VIVLRQRLISGISLAIGIIALVVLDGYLATIEPPQWFVYGVNVGRWLCNGAISTALVLVMTLLMVRELTQFAGQLGYRPLRFETYFFAAFLVVGPYISFNVREQTAWLYDESWGMLWLTIALGYVICAQAVRRGTELVIVNVATTMFFIFFAGGLAGYLTKVRMEEGGSAGAVLFLFSIFVVKMTDVGAYFTGLTFGQHKLIPWLSPKKTWEGLAGGILIAVLCSVVVGNLLEHAGLIRLEGVVFRRGIGLALFGLVMAIFSIAGDLAASLIKRDAAVKDSGDMIPGMGGVLDVIDSPLLAAPAAWFFWERIARIGIES